MPFLLPALTALICDCTAIYLASNGSSSYGGGYGVDTDEESHRLVYQSSYVLPTAVIRLFLLMIPLPYHSYNGTALRCPKLYQILYGGTVAVLLLHMLALSMIDPNSIASLLPTAYSSSATDAATAADASSTGSMPLTPHGMLTRHLWLLLGLSLISNCCHLLLFLHVRSTAPTNADLLAGRRPRVLFYYAAKEREDTERDGLLRSNDNNTSNNNFNRHEYHPPHSPTNSSVSSSNRMQQLSNQFVMEFQIRLKQAKAEWSKRLDDYRARSGGIPSSGGSVGSSGGGGTNNNNNNNNSNSSGNNQDLLHRPLAPFRVLLQLFAYEDVLTNGRLNAVYDRDNGAALMFFVPQLLSFLLHGAYDSSPLLEEWILDTCRRNVYFAHRCYWFLRAWCLETNNTSDGMPARLSKSSSLASFEALEETNAAAAGQTDATASASQKADEKFLPEERAVLEELLMRVMKCGEEPARLLCYGNGMDTEISSSLSDPTATDTSNFLSPSSLMFAAESGAIPIDPGTGTPSARHFESVAAARKYGFLPLDRALIAPGLKLKSTDDGPYQNSCFDATPVFLDALLTLAESLFRVPREQRTSEFRRQLQLLEVQALPSNAIYIPLQTVNHRVWRIVADESIAISTKERVPCIVCLEVVEYSPDDVPPTRDVRRLLERVAVAPTAEPNLMLPDLKNATNHNNNNPTDSDLINRWRYGYRSPHRLDTAFEKFAHSIQHGIRKIPIDQMRHSMQAQIEKLKDTRTSLQDFLTFIPDTFDEDDDEEGQQQSQGRRRSDQQQHQQFQHQPMSLHATESEDIERGDTIATAASNVQNDNNSLYKGHPQSDTATVPLLLPNKSNKNKINSSNSSTKINSNSINSSNNNFPTAPESPPAPVKKTAMGQWSSPHHQRDVRDRFSEEVETKLDDLLLPPGRRQANELSYQRMMGADAAIIEFSQPTNGNGNGRSHSTLSARTQPSELAFNGRGGLVQQGDDNMATTSNNANNRKLPTRPPPVVFKENWKEKEDRLRSKSAYGTNPGWRLLPILVKANDDLRQEQLASQIISRIAVILARERIPVWLCPYEILALTESGGLIEAIPDTISLSSLKKNDSNFTSLKGFFHSHFTNSDDLADAKANFCESLAAYSIVCFLLQIKDRHNGNILLDNRGHLIHIDFGFFFLSSPGKNTGFESAPFKLTREFVDVLDGPDSRLFRIFRMLCYKSFIALRRHCLEIILLVEMLKKGNEDLPCFRGRPDDAISELRHRFRLDLNDRACLEYVNALVDESLENWRTNWYDRYQRYCVGVL